MDWTDIHLYLQKQYIYIFEKVITYTYKHNLHLNISIQKVYKLGRNVNISNNIIITIIWILIGKIVIK